MNDLVEIVLKVGLSALLGGLVGAERERTGKWAGLRTHMLIAVGAALLTDVSVAVGNQYGPNAGWDPGRIAAQIVSGLGFIGAGTIIQSRGTVHGLTTAAGLWVAGAIGLAVGAGFWSEAAVTTVALLLILAALRPVASWLARGNRQTVVLRLDDESRLSEVMEVLEGSGVDLDAVDLSRRTEPKGPRSVRIRFRGSDEERRELLRDLEARDFVELEGDGRGG